MQRVIPLELVGNEKLDYDLYNENGEIIYTKGDKLTPDLLMMLNFRNVYKRKIDKIILTKQEIEEGKPEYQSVISNMATDFLVKNAKEAIKSAFNNKKVSIATCVEVRDTIVEEVKSKVNDIECIAQLRVTGDFNISHCINVATMSTTLGIVLGLNDVDIKDLSLAAYLHDIGKTRIPKDILNKPGKLDPEEKRIMQGHTLLGYQYLLNEVKLPDKICRATLEHHEKYGGGGYPHGLKGKAISLFAQIIAIADAYDTHISKKVYEKGTFSHEALKKMLTQGSSAFNPYILYKFIYLANYKDTTNLVIEEKDKI